MRVSYKYFVFFFFYELAKNRKRWYSTRNRINNNNFVLQLRYGFDRRGVLSLCQKRTRRERWMAGRRRRCRRRSRRHRRRRKIVSTVAAEIHSWCGCGNRLRAAAKTRSTRCALSTYPVRSGRAVRRALSYSANAASAVFINGHPDLCVVLLRYKHTHAWARARIIIINKKKGFTGNYNASGLNVPIIMYIHHRLYAFIRHTRART